MCRDIALIGTAGVPARYGGFETLAENLALVAGERFVIYCEAAKDRARPTEYAGAQLRYITLSANGPMSMIYDAVSMLDALWRGHQRLLVLGVSGAFMFPLIRVFRPSARLVCNIDGIEWQRQKWRGPAKWLLRHLERLAVRYAHTVICDNQGVYEHVASLYGVSEEIQVLAYGGDHVLREPGDCFSPLPEEYALGICRVEPENNVHLILSAFSKTDMTLVFIGNWDGSKYGRELRRQFGGHPRLKLLDPIYDLKELNTYRRHCALYVHGHSAGGTNPSLVEMMFFDATIIMFDCAYNRYSAGGHGQYFASENDIRDIIDQGIWKAQDSTAIRAQAEEQYCWRPMVDAYLAVFD